MAVKFTKPEINVREKLVELDKPSGIAGEAMLRAETPQEQFNLINAGRRNLVINGDMRIAQRGTGAFTANASYPVDRWQMISNTTDFTTTQDSTVPTGQGFTKSIKIQPTGTKSPSSSTYARIGYSIEGYDGAPLSWGTSGAKSATISFWVRSSVTGTYSIGVKNGDANRSITLEYTIDSANTWEYKNLTFSGVTDGTWAQTNGRFCYIDVWLSGEGSETSTIGVWQNTNTNMSSNQVNFFTSTSNVFYITGFQMEVGKVATPFEHRSYGEELALCLRYCYVLDSTNDKYNFTGTNYTSSNTYFKVQYPVMMRTDPTTSVNTLTANSYSAGAVTANGVGVSVNNTRKLSAQLYTAISGTAGHASHTDIQSGQLVFDAEL